MKSPIALLSRFSRRGRDKAVDDDATLLAGYRSKPMGLPIQAAFYVLLAAIFTGYGLIHGLTTPFQTMPLLVPIFVTAALIVWALPPGERTPWRAIEPLYLAFLISLTVWPDYLAVALPNLPWITLKRIASAPMAIVMLVCVSVSRDFRSNLFRVVNSDKWIWRILVTFVIMQTFSILISWDPGKSLNKYFIYQLNWTLLFFASCFLFNLRGFAAKWSTALIVIAYVICIYGLWEAKYGLLPWAGHIPTFLRIEDESVLRLLAGVVRSVKGVHRVQSSSTTPLGMSELLGLIAPFALYTAITSRSWVLKVLSALLLPLSLQLVLLADSRLGMVAMLGAVLFYVLIWGALKWRRESQNIFAPALVLTYPAFFATTLMATVLIGRIRTRIWGDGSQAASTESRSEQWAMGLPKVATHPFGHGIGGAAHNLGYVQGDGIITIDSYYLTLLMDMGVLGLIVYFSMFLRGIWLSARTVVLHPSEGELGLLLPLSVSLTNFVIIKSVFSQDANHPIVFMMLGAVLALSYRATQGAAARTQPVHATKRAKITTALPAVRSMLR